MNNDKGTVMAFNKQKQHFYCAIRKPINLPSADLFNSAFSTSATSTQYLERSTRYISACCFIKRIASDTLLSASANLETRMGAVYALVAEVNRD